MKKVILISVCLALLTMLGSYLSNKQSEKLKKKEGSYEEIIKTFNIAVHYFEIGDMANSSQQFDCLETMVNDHKTDKQLDILLTYKEMYSGLISYKKAEEDYRTYVALYTTHLKAKMPDPDIILDGYKKFEISYTKLLAEKEMSSPKVAWRIENDIATVLAWQLVIRWAMKDEKFEDLQPIYNESLAHYKKAMILAEETMRSNDQDEDFENPARYVSQNLDFMTRIMNPSPETKSKAVTPKGLGDFLSQARNGQKSGQGKGLGALLSKLKDDLGEKFLPLPMKGPVGSGRIIGGKQ